MQIRAFAARLDESIAVYDLLRHSFYKAWSRGELSREDLREYARNYYHHVEAFPRVLAHFARRLGKSELRAVVLANLSEEIGPRPCDSHAALWLNFAEGLGVKAPIRTPPSPGVRQLMAFFQKMGGEGTPEQVLAALYAYESQVPRIATEKLRGLREFYGADDRTCQYFLIHIIADVNHAEAWRRQLEQRIERYPQLASTALDAAHAASFVLWQALDGIERDRFARQARASQLSDSD